MNEKTNIIDILGQRVDNRTNHDFINVTMAEWLLYADFLNEENKKTGDLRKIKKFDVLTLDGVKLVIQGDFQDN